MPRTQLDNLWRLLPWNATDLERDLLAVSGFDNVLTPLLPPLNTFKYVDIPDDVVPWLLIEYGLNIFSPYLEDPRELLTEGLLINREKGTAAAIVRAMGWLGFTATVREEIKPGIHFPEYQIQLDRVPTDAELCRICHLAELVQPLRSRLRRIFHGKDIGPFILDQTIFGEGLLSHYSGVNIRDLGLCPDCNVWASFARTYKYEIPETGSIGDDLTIDYVYKRRNIYNVSIAPRQWPILSHDHLGQFYPKQGTIEAQFRRTLPINELKRVSNWHGFLWGNNSWTSSGSVWYSQTDAPTSPLQLQNGEPLELQNGEPLDLQAISAGDANGALQLQNGDVLQLQDNDFLELQ